MSDLPKTQADLENQSYVSHLVELRTGMVRSGAAVVVAFIGLIYWAPDIFRLLARPLVRNLPEGGKLIVTDVTGSFFVPIVVVMLARAGIVSVAKLRQIRHYVIVGVFAVAAVVTPPDVLSQFILAVPLIILYEAGLIAARLVTGSRSHDTGAHLETK